MTSKIETELITTNFPWVLSDTKVQDDPNFFLVSTESYKSWVYNWAMARTPDQDFNIERVQEIIRPYSERSCPLAWFVGTESSPENLAIVLADCGFTEHWTAASMVIDTGSYRSIEENSDVHFSRVTGEELPLFLKKMFEGFEGLVQPVPGIEEAIRLQMGRDNYEFRAYFAWIGQEIVGTSISNLKGRQAYIRGANTLKEFRGRGVYRSMMKHRLKELCDSGVKKAFVHANVNTAFDLCKKMGFEASSEVKYFLWGGKEL